MKKILYIAHENTKSGATHSLINLLDYLPPDIKPHVLIPKTLNVRSIIKKMKNNLLYSDTLKKELDKRDIPYYQAFYYYDNLKQDIHWLKRKFFTFIRKDELKRMKGIVEQEGIQLIHSNSSVVKFGADLAKLSGIKHIWHVREDVKEMFEIEKELLSEYYSTIVSRSEKVVFVSNELRTEFQNVLNYHGIQHDLTKLITVYDGLPLHLVTADSTNNRIEATVSNPFTITCIGTVYKIKGQEDLIELARKLKQDTKGNYRILIIGQTKKKYYAQLLQKVVEYGVQDMVQFIDYTNDLMTLREASDVEVVCSRNEAFGRVAIEAMHFGNPLIVTAVGGLNEIVDHGQSGLKYNPGDVEQLYQYIMDVQLNRINVQGMIEKEKLRASEFDIRTCVLKVCELYL
ncbi:glycosyltransferase family 4 protein [Paenibacillus sp. FA6]|uniref:glycosyltransferase family 4 protein n=1 Tax=Paenibacillus sp. FA6 TaxID=3413029 RepID=UPI003F65ADAC